MPKAKNPRHGSMQFWPRKLAKRVYARIRSWNYGKETKPLGFAGYKVGMTHVMFTDNKSTSLTKGEDITSPVTVIECPPLRIYSVKFYKKDGSKLKTVSEVLAEKLDKNLERKIIKPKKVKASIDKVTDYDDVRLGVHTIPVGKKKPEVFEIALGGSKEDKLNYAKEKLGQELTINDVFAAGQLVDVRSVTKGKGFQGPVKRFGVSIRHHKSEKTKRGPGSLGGWKAQGHFMYRVAHAGKMGCHQRTEHNKWIIKVSDNVKEINPKGGFLRYGEVRNNYVLLKGSIPGAIKRLIVMTAPLRPNKKVPDSAPEIQYISLESKQKK